MKSENARQSAGVVMPTESLPSIPRWKFPKWQPQFQDAILEFDPNRLPSLLDAATTAMFERLQSTETSPEELRALANALRVVRTVQAKRLTTPGRAQQKRCA